jgi:sigma-B regulation protein RsbU (phosphoserine phosphatase)
MSSRLPERDSGPQARSPASRDGDGQSSAPPVGSLPVGHDIYCGIIDGSNDLIAALDPDFRYLVFNHRYGEEFQRVFGIPVHVGDCMAELLAPWPEQQANAVAMAHRALGGETATVVEEFGAAEHRRYFEISFGPIYDRQGRAIGTSHIVRDVTSRRQVEEALRQSEERYRQLLAAVTTYTYSVVLDQGAPVSTEHSSGCVAATGYSPADYQANPSLWIEMVPPDDRPIVRQHVDAVLAGQIMPPLEHRIIHKDRSTRWLRDTIVPHYDAAGRLCRYNGLVEDITERKRSEDRFRQLLESTPDAMLITDRHGRIVLVNDQTERVFGYRRAELLGQSVEMLVPGQLREVHARHRAAYLVQPQTRPMNSGMELSALAKNGREFPAEISLRPVATDEGMLVFCAVRDITERKRAERVLRENAVQLLAAQRIQEHLLPRSAPNIPGLDIAGASYPAEFAAGDYFDYLPMSDNLLGIVVGDVAGHGFGPALLMASIHAHLQSLALMHADVDKILTLVNAALLRETDEDRFVTLLLGQLDLGTQTFVYCNAGHPDGYVLDAAGRVKTRLESDSLPLGICADTSFVTGRPVMLEPGDLLLLLTDGILEAQAGGGAQFGIERTLEFVRTHRRQPAAEIIRLLYDAVVEFSECHKVADDLTAVIVKVLES